MAKKIAVTGTGRSGTKYFASILQELNLDIGHEETGGDGIASWCLVADVKKAVYGPGGAVLDKDFIVGQQVRHPLQTIASLTTINKASWAFIREQTGALPRNVLHRSMVHWLDWNQRAYDMADYTWKLRTVEEEIPEIITALNVNITEAEWKDACERAKYGANTGEARATNSLLNPKVGPITQWRRYQYNKRKELLTWDELKKKDALLTQEIQDFATVLGYKIED